MGAPGRETPGRSGVSGDEARANGEAGETRDVVNLERLHELRPIPFGSLGADIEPGRDFLGRMPLGNQLQHFALSGGEALERGLLPVDAPDAGANHMCGYCGTQEPLAARYGSYWPFQTRRGRAL